MSQLSIRGVNLGKRYALGERMSYVSLRDMIANAIKAPARLFASDGANGKSRREEIWALQDVSFEVQEGEVVGLIGRNGAGKTTLLKILSRVTRPTTGFAEVYGRIGSLLEVGTGFHPELTGRENIFLSGAILGMNQREINRKFDEMVAFAEVARFIDTPLKHYSTGMQMRLAFAVAAHLEPEILLVDEVLAVGDTAFQKKCLGKMGDVSKRGRTIIFVSHNMTAMQALCTRILWLDRGSILQAGPTAPIISAYLAKVTSAPATTLWPDQSSAPGNDLVRIRKINVRPEKPVDGRDLDYISVRTPVVMEFEYWKLSSTVQITLSVHVYAEDGARAFNTFPLEESFATSPDAPAGLFRSYCYVPGDLLNAGTYRLSLLVVRDRNLVIFDIEDAFVFEVRDERIGAKGFGKILGAVRPALKWHTEIIEAVDSESAPP